LNSSLMEGFDSSNFVLFVLLLSAVALGFWMGNWQFPGSRKSPGKKLKTPPDDYFIGLNYLLNDEPDDAIDIFIDALEVNSGTLETHMALGTLLRRRGKVDRSIAVYLDLLGQSGFNHRQVNEIKINLVQSYIAAGLLDRAEHLLEELRQEKGGIKIKALVNSVHIYQQEKEWNKAIEAVSELIKVCAPVDRSRYQTLASHFYCQLADDEIAREHLSKARELLQKAWHTDRENVRVSIMQAQLEQLCGNYREAIKSYELVTRLAPEFRADVFTALIDCYKKAGKEKGLKKFIESCKQESTDTTVLLGVADCMEKEEGPDQARTYLVGMLEKKPSLRLLLKSIELAEETSPSEGWQYATIRRVLHDYIESKARYQCIDCGFELKTLHWHCPSCSGWGSVKHVRGILGE